MAPTPPLPVTEDTPPDMLAGSMDLRVVLPSGHSVKMSVERSTPMMDLLVQVTTVNKISTGGHVLQAIGERGILPYKPSTPIGALDTWTIQVVPKSKVQTTTVQKKAPLKPLNQQQPFEQTFRLQVHLPRNQLFVMRVSPRTLLSDILHQTCREKNLDPNKYELRHPANLSQLLNQSCTLADYSLQEVTVVARSCAPGMGSALSSSDIMALQREEDKRRQQARQQHGTGTGLGLVFNKQSQSSVCEGSISSDSLGGRSISPARSDESASRSASPPAPSLPPMIAPLPPARPARKRRPAPKPPSSNNGPVNNKQQTESNMQAESSSGTVVNGHSGSSNTKATHVPVSHSRNSSDSSGYHEASVLSESPAEGHQMSESCTADTLPHHGRVSGQPARMRIQGGSHGLSRSMSSLTGVGSMAGCQHSTSNTSLASSTGQGQKKKKAPPPPPGAGGTKDYQQQKHLSSSSLSSTNHTITEPHNKTTSLERHLSNKSSEVGSGQQLDKCSTLPGKMKMSEGDYRPVDPPVHKSNNTPETKTLSPEENCLEKDQKIPELEDASVAYVSKETSVIHSQMHEDEHNIAAISQSSGGDIPEIQDECYQHLPVPPVETAPETHVELSARSKSPQVVDTSTPEGKLVAGKLEMGPDLSSWEGSCDLQGVAPCFRCKGKHSSTFTSEASPLTSKCSLGLRIHSLVPNDCKINAYTLEPQVSHQKLKMKIIFDDYDHKNIISHSKCTSKMSQDINSALPSSASSKCASYNSEQELCNMTTSHPLPYVGNKAVLPSCNKITDPSFFNLNQELVNSDSENFRTLVRSSSTTVQQNSDFVFISPEKNSYGVDIHNHSSPKNVICSGKLDNIRSHMSEQETCSSMIALDQFIHDRNWNNITNPSDKLTMFHTVGNGTHSSSPGSKCKYDGKGVEEQLSPENRVSLLDPPPADFLVSRGESRQSWNKFLQDLDRILENRAEFV